MERAARSSSSASHGHSSNIGCGSKRQVGGKRSEITGNRSEVRSQMQELHTCRSMVLKRAQKSFAGSSVRVMPLPSASFATSEERKHGCPSRPRTWWKVMEGE